MNEAQLKVQARRNSQSEDWYDVPEVASNEVGVRNREYGWQKYRVTAAGDEQ